MHRQRRGKLGGRWGERKAYRVKIGDGWDRLYFSSLPFVWVGWSLYHTANVAVPAGFTSNETLLLGFSRIIAILGVGVERADWSETRARR